MTLLQGLTVPAVRGFRGSAVANGIASEGGRPEQGSDARMIMEVLRHGPIRSAMDTRAFARRDSQRSAFDLVGDAPPGRRRRSGRRGPGRVAV
ncbi:hypothetical protein [Streptomyces sp. NPDC059015]|uniref:hypothetical protein n=1 Tax=unclassified Streptomyces TaxID=2593676 RepID=UPI0036A0151A